MNSQQESWIGHIGDINRNAKEKMQVTSLKHLSIFIENYHHDVQVLTAYMDAFNLPYSVVSDESFVGKYIHYLATEATHLGKHIQRIQVTYLYFFRCVIYATYKYQLFPLTEKGKNDILAHATVLSYASTFAEYYINKYKEFNIPKPLQKELWTKKLSQLTKLKSNYHHKNKTKMKESKETATDDDRRNIAIICMLEGQPHGAEVFHVINSAVSLAGRGSDIADASLKNISCGTRTEGLLTYNILVQDLTRFKTSTRTDLQLFPHRDEMFFCYYFSLSYLLLVGEHNPRYSKLFPRFAEKVFKDDGSVDSKVATFFNDVIDKYWQLMSDYCDGEM
jgi:hypothetical protein